MKPEPIDRHSPEKRIRIKRSDGSIKFVTAGELAALNEKNKIRRELQISKHKNRQLKQLLLISWIVLPVVFATYYVIQDKTDVPTTTTTLDIRNPDAGSEQNKSLTGNQHTSKNPAQAGHNEKQETEPGKNTEIPIAKVTEKTASPVSRIFYKHDVAQTIQDWARVWSNQDIKSYLAFYSQRFTPENNSMSYQQWGDSRKARLETPDWITVNIDDIEISAPDESGNVTARFKQDYLTNSYQDRTLKELVLAREDNDWLILRETSIKPLPQQFL